MLRFGIVSQINPVLAQARVNFGDDESTSFWLPILQTKTLKDKFYSIFKAVLNDDKMDFECLLKPPFKIKSERKVNENTPSKLLQKTLWEKYIDICDQSEHPDMQIKEALPRHYQYVAINKSGVQILQTINTEKNFVASEILIVLCRVSTIYFNLPKCLIVQFLHKTKKTSMNNIDVESMMVSCVDWLWINFLFFLFEISF